MTIKEKILIFLEKQGIDKSIFFQETGLASSNFRGAGLKSEIGGDKIVKILTQYPSLSAEWLLNGVEPMLKTKQLDLVDKANKVINDKDRVIAELNKQVDALKKATEAPANLSKHLIAAESQLAYNVPTGKGIPLIPFEAMAGYVSMDNEGVGFDQVEERYYIPEFNDKKVEFLIRVSGSSMYPKYSSGDILGCKKIDNVLFFQWGKIYVIDSSQGALVKRIREDKDNPDNIICVSDNSENYPPFSLPKSDIRSLSIVIGAIRLE